MIVAPPLTRGIYAVGDDAAEQIEAKFAAMVDRTGEQVPQSGLVQAEVELAKHGL
jgi:hypothetical protein